MTRDLISRIEERLAATGKTAEKASKDAGLGREFIRTLKRRPEAVPRADNLLALAQSIHTSIEYLLEETDDPRPKPGTADAAKPTMPILFEVAAGPWLATEDLAQDPLGWRPVAEDPRYPYPQWLELVRGDSFDQRIPEGAIVQVVDAQAMGYSARHGDVVIARRSRGQGALVERTLKQVEVTNDGQVQLWPRSHNPKWSSPISLGQPGADDIVVDIAAKVIRAFIDL